MSSRSRSEEVLITRACDMCRKKKIRCNTTSNPEICLQCIKYKTQCHFTPISVKRAPRRPASDRRVEELERKLKLMEEQLKRAAEKETIQESRVEFRESDDSESQFGGSFSTPSYQDYENLDPVLAKVGLPSQASGTSIVHQRNFLPPVPAQSKPSPWNLMSVDRDLAKPVFKTLPSKDRVIDLVQESFQNFTSAFPLFDQANFMEGFNSSDPAINNPGWWASLNIVLALADRFESPTQHKQEEGESWGYFQNALAVSNQLITMQSHLSAVQALVGMALVIQGTPRQGPASMLISSAIKLAQRMGLHRRCEDPNISFTEIEERKRVFWLAYSLDKDICLQTGDPPTQDDDDMDVELPFEDLAPAYPPHNVNLFNYRVKLAMVQGQIYKRLCSVKASKQSISERLEAIQETETMLRAWRESVPIDCIGDWSRPIHQAQTLRSCQHPVSLQLIYFNTLAVIYNSIPAMPRYQELQGQYDPMALRVMSTPTSYTIEARKAIKILQFTPQRNYGCIWATLHIFVTATTILLSHTLTNPSDPLALGDLRLIEPLLSILGTLAKSGSSEKVATVYGSCAELFDRAKMAVESCNPGMARVSSGGEEKESVEAFLGRMERMAEGYYVDLATVSQR